MRQKMSNFGLHDVFVFNIQIGSGSCSCGNGIHTPMEHPLTAAFLAVAQRGIFGYLLSKLGTLGRPPAESSKDEGKWTGDDASVVLSEPIQPGILDCSEWRLTAAETDSLSLCGIIKKLKESDDLNPLIVKGTSGKQTIYDLLHGLVKDGGRFCVWDAWDRAVIDVWHRSGV
ncbi:hypothetical protein N7G274_005711 [Stereocaulon virgatum]|uniref:Uncharacterized protein n=1 Tax=Stereocaulon virgatum TaxID=373712 RepID=A0ABR4A9A5_9LECA